MNDKKPAGKTGATLHGWLTVGASVLATAIYAPELAYRALGEARALTPWLVIGVIVTVLVIAMAHRQIVELFPAGGGGYRLASRLLGPTPDWFPVQPCCSITCC